MFISREEAMDRDIRNLNEWRETAVNVGTYDQWEQYRFMFENFERHYGVKIEYSNKWHTHLIIN